MTDYRPREMAAVVESALADLPIVVLTGMRQSGKSTLLQHDPAFRRRRYVTLDDIGTLSLAKSDPEGFVQGSDALTIDEAHRCPELLVAIKRAVDLRRRPGQFLLSGSANFSLLRQVTESLAGRAVYYPLHPFSWREHTNATRREPFLKRIWETGRPPQHTPCASATWQDVRHGGMPAVRLGIVKGAPRWFHGYVQTYLERDLRAISRVPDLIDFRKLMQLAALRTAQLLRTSELARDAGLTPVTARRHLNLLQTSYITDLIGPATGSSTSRLVKSPKFYFTDSGLACHLAGVDSTTDLRESPLWGAMLETWAHQQLAAFVATWQPAATLSYWTIQGRYEVDFIIASGRDSIAVEVKSAARWGEGDLRGLRVYLDRTPGCKAAILAHMGTGVGRLGDRLWAVPLSLLLS